MPWLSVGAGELETNSAPEGNLDGATPVKLEPCTRRLRGDVGGEDFGLPFRV